MPATPGTREQRTNSQSCETRQGLAANFSTAARLYAEAVVLYTSNGVADPEKYERLRHAVDEAQKTAQLAAIQYEEHVAQHQCHG